MTWNNNRARRIQIYYTWYASLVLFIVDEIGFFTLSWIKSHRNWAQYNICATTFKFISFSSYIYNAYWFIQFLSHSRYLSELQNQRNTMSMTFAREKREKKNNNNVYKKNKLEFSIAHLWCEIIANDNNRCHWISLFITFVDAMNSMEAKVTFNFWSKISFCFIEYSI